MKKYMFQLGAHQLTIISKKIILPPLFPEYSQDLPFSAVCEHLQHFPFWHGNTNYALFLSPTNLTSINNLLFLSLTNPTYTNSLLFHSSTIN